MLHVPAMTRLEADYIVSANDPDCVTKSIRLLDELGVVVIRGLVSDSDMDTLCATTKKILSRPAIGGSVGYYMKDPNKKMFDCFLLGPPAIAASTNAKLTDVLDGYLGRETVMAAGILKHDLGNGRSYFPYHSHTGDDLDKIEGEPFGCGMMVYLHDTDVGAFCYSPGTHKLDSPHGADPYRYPEPLRSQILFGMRRISGLRGDTVIFDGRGFHGPEQPVRVSRTVLLNNYVPIAFCRNGAIKNGQPIIVTDLTGLDPRQLRMLGVGMKSTYDLERFHAYSFYRTRGYRIIAFCLEAWWKFADVVERSKNVVRSIRGRKAAYDAADV